MAAKKKVYKHKSVKFGGMTITTKKAGGGWQAVVIGKTGGKLPGVSGSTGAESIAKTKALLVKAGAKSNPCTPKSNPVRHFPKLKGRGRPSKLRTWEMTTVLTNGAVAVRSGLKATKEQAAAKAQKILGKRFKGKRVKEVILDDGK